ncbi:hypothetical protein [Xanthomonas oryzae]|uniref:hypothetical protein n=1 Tax=Xanthomonas oryzae TaxID=347 RepID=UPI001A9CDBDA|nr:hypothetical protein [Xanthomonas oryzae]
MNMPFIFIVTCDAHRSRLRETVSATAQQEDKRHHQKSKNSHSYLKDHTSLAIAPAGRPGISVQPGLLRDQEMRAFCLYVCFPFSPDSLGIYFSIGRCGQLFCPHIIHPLQRRRSIFPEINAKIP